MSVEENLIRRVRRAGGCLLVLVTATAAWAETSAQRLPGHDGMFARVAAATAHAMPAQQREEWHFLKDAAATSRFMGEAARLALARSSNPEVRSLAATLINHHASAGHELLHMLHERGMALPMLANDQRKMLNRLAKLHGAKFDLEFVSEVGLKQQQQDIQSFERASLIAGEPVLKAWIDNKLPTLRYYAAAAARLDR